MGNKTKWEEMLYSSLNNENLFWINTFVKITKNEVAYILFNEINIYTDVTVLNKFHTGTGHILLCANIRIHQRTERYKLIKAERYPTMETLTQRKVEYQNKLGRRLKPMEIRKCMPINERATKINEIINTFVKKVCSNQK